LAKRGWRNPRKRRDRLHIIAKILQIARDGALKTPIMYKANLSFAQLNEYLSYLLQIELLETITKDEEIIYKATDKGLKYLQGYAKIRDLLKEEEATSRTKLISPW